MKTQTAQSIITIITHKGRVRPDELKKALKLTAAAIHRQLNKLVSQGVLIKQGTPPRVFYALAKTSRQNEAEYSVPGYLIGLDSDLQKALSEQLQVMWAHTSTALEGNSLTLGETHQVLSAGLTISGKPLADHNEVLGHARAEALMEALLQSDSDIAFDDLYRLHSAIQTSVVHDVYEPIGVWKNQPNSTVVIIDKKSVVNDTYAHPDLVPNLMKIWLNKLNDYCRSPVDPLGAYAWLHAAFVRIHPFADGNGRMARLLANLPVLRAGEPPILIPKEKRQDYIQLLARWQLSLGRPRLSHTLVVANKNYFKFKQFCDDAWLGSKSLVKKIHALQRRREQK